ncbi:hypothetical protein AD929_12415 [Gluconobacter potus]|uniref:Uncharacterized protein n=2 Tax=Gluconobacter potus TaxID=2724927 RepID=A0A149QRW0_9PROT|nr:hypothetical protein AD929_12415 [Gluconobacter potus]
MPDMKHQDEDDFSGGLPGELNAEHHEVPSHDALVHRRMSRMVYAIWAVVLTVVSFCGLRYQAPPLDTPAAVLSYQTFEGALLSVAFMALAAGLSVLSLVSAHNLSRIVLALMAVGMCVIAIVPPLHAYRDNQLVNDEMMTASKNYASALARLDSMNAGRDVQDVTPLRRIALDMRRGMFLDVPTYLMSDEAFRVHQEHNQLCLTNDQQACSQAHEEDRTFMPRKSIISNRAALLSMFSTSHLSDSP